MKTFKITGAFAAMHHFHVTTVEVEDMGVPPSPFAPSELVGMYATIECAARTALDLIQQNRRGKYAVRVHDAATGEVFNNSHLFTMASQEPPNLFEFGSDMRLVARRTVVDGSSDRASSARPAESRAVTNYRFGMNHGSRGGHE